MPRTWLLHSGPPVILSSPGGVSAHPSLTRSPMTANVAPTTARLAATATQTTAARRWPMTAKTNAMPSENTARAPIATVSTTLERPDGRHDGGQGGEGLGSARPRRGPFPLRDDLESLHGHNVLFDRE